MIGEDALLLTFKSANGGSKNSIGVTRASCSRREMPTCWYKRSMRIQVLLGARCSDSLFDS